MIYNLADNKQMGFSDVVITGQLTGDFGSNSIETIEFDENAPVEYYNLQGIRVENPTHGIYIKRQGSSVKKVIIK